MTNAQKFLDKYNELDQYLSKVLNENEYVPFGTKVREYSRKNSVVRRYQDDLYLFGNLRNAIAHRTKGGVAIAEPLDTTVGLINKIVEELKNPIRVIPIFQCEVFSIQTNDSLKNLLEKMKELNISQVPVMGEKGNIIEIVSTNTISRWLYNEFKNDIVELSTYTISDLLPHIEVLENYSFISRNTSIYEASEIYLKKSQELKSQVDCLIITENGKSTEKMLGIVCIEDMAKFLVF